MKFKKENFGEYYDSSAGIPFDENGLVEFVVNEQDKFFRTHCWDEDENDPCDYCGKPADLINFHWYINDEDDLELLSKYVKNTKDVIDFDRYFV